MHQSVDTAIEPDEDTLGKLVGLVERVESSIRDDLDLSTVQGENNLRGEL